MTKLRSGFKKFWQSIKPSRPYIIRPYWGYGTDRHFYNTGRALVDKKVRFKAGQHIFRTIANTYRLFQSDELRKVNLRLELPNGSIHDTTTDSEGYYLFELHLQGLREHTLLTRNLKRLE